MDSENKEREMVSAGEICRRFNIARGTLYQYIKSGRIPTHDASKPYYVRRAYLFDPAEVAAALATPRR